MRSIIIYYICTNDYAVMTDHISGASTTVHVENLIKTIVRAFYPDECVCIIDVLLRDKYLRDDDMGPRLSLPVKQLRRTMEYLHQEMLVKYELVDDLAAGGSQQTKFWYVDYNHCVNVIRWRVFKLKKEMEKVELLARSSSMYVCPNYSKKICNGTYSELEAQQILDYDTGLFLCQECVKQFSNHPEVSFITFIIFLWLGSFPNFEMIYCYSHLQSLPILWM